MTVTSPTPSYLSVWQDLGIEAPKNADQRGFVSPSGKQVLYPVLFERDASNPYGRSEIRLAAASQEKESLLLKLDWRAELSQIQWLPDESGVFFDIPQEGGGAVVYRVDVQTGEVQRLEDISEFDGWSFGWELSPDGTLLAVTGSDGLYMIDLENGHAKRIEEKAIGLHWSKDSRRIYYWKCGPSYEMCFEDAEATNLRLYDRDTENVDTLIEASEFAEFEKTLGVSLKCSPFLVSPDEKYVAFKPGELWMLALNDTQR
jgi:Tol biopolymer transport system component